MADPTDIDALLIGALYGELTPADEARLTAHLESHPADRTALADLTQIRTQLRDSRLLMVQLDPPQSVTALLLQEAARRAPRRETDGWFQRLVRSLTAHPAMAAAMTLVLVVGVAGTLYMRHEDGFGAPPPDMMSATQTAKEATVASEQAAPPAAPAANAGSASFGGDQAPAAAAPAADPAAVADKRELDSQLKGDLAQVEKARLSQDMIATGAADDRGVGWRPSAPAVGAYAAAPTTPSPTKRGKQGIEVRGGAALAPKELPTDEERKYAEADRDGVADAKDAPGGPAHVGMAASKSARPATTSDESVVASKPRAPEPVQAQAAPAPSPSGGAASGGGGAPDAPPRHSSDANKLRLQEEHNTATTEGRAADIWAQKQHEQVIAYVRANNCRAAASAANEIYSRAPDYYAANVEVDRSIKPCLAYLNTERERTDRARAASKRSEAGPAAPAPPPARK